MASDLRSFPVNSCHLADHYHDHTHENPMEDLTITWQDNAADVLGFTLSPHSRQRWSSFMRPYQHFCTLHLTPLNAF